MVLTILEIDFGNSLLSVFSEIHGRPWGEKREDPDEASASESAEDWGLARQNFTDKTRITLLVNQKHRDLVGQICRWVGVIPIWFQIDRLCSSSVSPEAKRTDSILLGRLSTS
jgi:hypothetical protein